MRAVFNGGFAGRESPLYHLKRGALTAGCFMVKVIFLIAKHKTNMPGSNSVIKPVYATLKWDQKGGREIPGLQNRHYNLHFVLFILCILFSVSNGKPSYGGSSKENRSFGVHSNSWHSVSIIS